VQYVASSAGLPESDPRIQAAAFAVSSPPSHNGHARKSRAEVREMRRKEREEGVVFHLKNSDFDARVRDLPFTDRIMLKGIPADMRVSIERAVDLTSTVQGNPGISTALNLMDAEADLSDAVCIAGFIWPRLVRTEHERTMALQVDGSAEDDVWLVEDLHPDEKAAYRDFVFRDRDSEKEDTARLASFPGAGMAEAPGREDRPGEVSGAFPSAADGRIGLRPRDATFAG
jgi:hypothetical protein